MKIRRVSFDYDFTLDREDVQNYAKYLMSKGVEVWVTTSRETDESINAKRAYPETWKYPPNWELYRDTDRLEIPRDRINFTAWVDKWTVIKNNNFIWHLDDDDVEIEQAIEWDCDCPFINVEIDGWKDECERLLNIKI